MTEREKQLQLMGFNEETAERRLKELKVTYDMYENVKKETEQTLKDKLNPNGTKAFTPAKIKERLALLEESQADVVKEYLMLGGTEEELKKKSRKRKGSSTPKAEMSDDILSMIAAMNDDKEQVKEEPVVAVIQSPTETIKEDFIPKTINYDIQESFDYISLPSNGECYKQKIGKMPVSYLTAYDENIIAQPNLYKENKVLDVILSQKIKNDTISPGDLLEGDREAIILWLRATGYGNEFPIQATDGLTGKQYDTTVDLSKIKYKEFKLKGDVNGWFDFITPLKKDKIKFRFLTHNDILNLDKLEMYENNQMAKERIMGMVDDLDEIIENENVLAVEDKIKTRQAIRTLEKWADKYGENEAPLYTHSLTNRLELSIMSVNDITDRAYIRKYVREMNVRDSSALRTYIKDNEPGIDYNVEIQKPESLGGGSTTVFLEFDQFIFLNLA